MTETLRVTYDLTLEEGEEAERKAVDIAHEQTAELSPELVPAGLRAHIPGRIESLGPRDDGRWRAVIAFTADLLANELTQTLNVLFGNISLKRGIRIVDIAWPVGLTGCLGGPGHGIDGLRRLTGVSGRALVATALKPVGLDSRELARITADFAAGGVDLIKDDHGITNQPWAPFTERLVQCQSAAGAPSVYFPNVSAPWPEMMRRAEQAAGAGCVGVLVNPMLTGLDAMHHLRDEYGLAILAHPSLTGTFFAEDHGIAAECFLGDIYRLAGADAVIYPNVGGRFGFSGELCERINERLRGPLQDCLPAMPAPGGGMSVERAGYWAEHYGRDTILLIGGSLYAQGDLLEGARKLRVSVEAAG